MRYLDALPVRKGSSSGDEITSSRDVGGRGAWTSCSKLQESVNCQKLEPTVGAPCGQPELPGVGVLTAVFSPLLPPKGTPLPADTTPAKPLPHASLQKPGLGQRDHPSVQRKTGSGGSGVASPQPCLPLREGWFPGATGTNPTDISSQTALEARGLKSPCPRHGLLLRSVGTGAFLGLRMAVSSLCLHSSNLCASLPQFPVYKDTVVLETDREPSL